jgi:hypothetical protein
MAQQKLDLVEFSSGIPTQAGAGPAEIMRGQLFNGCSFGAFLYDVPYNPLRHAVSPSLACAANAPKHAAFAHTSGYKPGIDDALDPIRNRHRPNMPGLAHQVNDDPVIFAALKMGDLELGRLFPAQSAAQEDPEQSPISLAFERVRVRHLPERPSLIGGEPVPQTHARFFGPLTRRMPAAGSGLSKPESAASYARRLTAASLPLIVPGAS